VRPARLPGHASDFVDTNSLALASHEETERLGGRPMTAPARIPPLDPNVTDDADADRERAAETIRRKIVTASGSRKRMLEQLLRELEARAAG
jgi:hypothetical protein